MECDCGANQKKGKGRPTPILSKEADPRRHRTPNRKHNMADKALRREFKVGGKEMTEEDKAVHQWKIKQLIKTLQNARG